MIWPGPESYKFCPLCGGNLANRLVKVGEPLRLTCTACGFVFYIDPKLAVIALVPLLNALKPEGLAWLIAGGVFYTAGIIFYVLDERMRHAHGIWHLFVLGGSVTHYFTVLLFVA